MGRAAYYYHLHESTPWLMTDGSKMFEKIEMLTEGVVTSDDGSIVTFDWKRLVMRSGPPVPPSHYEKLRRWHTENPSQVKMILNRALEFSRWYGTVPDAWYDIEIPEAWQLLRQLSAVPAAGTDSFAFMESESLFYDRPGDEDLNGVAYLDTTLLVWLFPNGIALGHTAYYYSCHKEPDYGKHRCFANCSTGNTAPCHKKDLLMEGVVTSIKGCIVTFDWNRAVAKESPGSCGSSESLESWRGNDVVQSLESWREVDIPPLVQFDKTTCETCSECRLEENPEWQRFKKFHQAQECSWSDTWYTLKRAVPLTAWQLLRQSTLVATLFSCREKRYGQVVVEFGLLSGETVQIEVPLENTLATVAALLCSRLNKHCHVRIVGLHGECLDGSRPIRDYTNQQLSIEPAIGPVRTLDCSIRASNCP